MKIIMLLFLFILITDVIQIINGYTKKKHDYYLDINNVGYKLYDTKDNRKVATWKWNEIPKLDTIIDKDNQ
jgi:hypothetical protein